MKLRLGISREMLLTIGMGRMPRSGRPEDDQRARSYWPLTIKPYSYEVDLGMLPAGTGTEATGLHEFCESLEAVLERDGDNFCRVVPAFSAFNAGADACEGWPTERQWGLALREVFGIIPFPSAGERAIRRSLGRHRGGSSTRRPPS